MAAEVRTILAVDDDPVQQRLLEGAITRMGHRFVKAEAGEAAISLLASPQGSEISVVLLDLVMPDIDGMAVLTALRDRGFDKPVIVLTAQGGIETVVGAMRLGAFDFLVKPISPDRLAATINNAIRYSGSVKAPARQPSRDKSRFGFKDIISSSPAMSDVIRIARKAAGSTIPVLIEGESGVGKELVARAIQGDGGRAGKPFVTVNCGALPENLVESILFGHEKGAFTGASEKHVGKFQEADGGTLFLDEIGELPSDLQVKLLRAIQEGEIDPVGARRPVRVDVRIVSATNRNLLDEVRANRFREDLFYRLSVLPLTVPPLRARREDIPTLVYHFVKKIAREVGKPGISAIRPDVMEALKAHDWPGNIRELENAIFRAVVLCDGDELTLAEFPQIAAQLPGFDLGERYSRDMTRGPVQAAAPSLATPENPVSPAPASPAAMATEPPSRTETAMPATGTYGMAKMISDAGQIRTIEEIEEEMIRFAIEIYGGRMSEVARRLGIGRSTLYRKLRQFGIEDGDGEDSEGFAA